MSLNGLGTTWPYLPLLTVSGSTLIISQAGDAIVDLSGAGGGGNPATWSLYPPTQQVEFVTQNLNDVGVLQCADSYSGNLFIGSPLMAPTNVGTALSDLFTGLGDTQTRLDQVQSGVWTYDPSGGPGTWYQYDAQTISISTVLAPLQLGAQAWYESVIPLVDSGVPVYVVVTQGALSQRFTVNATDTDPGVKYLLFSSATAAPAWVVGQPTQFSAYTVNTDNAAQWATFPAVQNINANGFSLTGAAAVSASGDITAFSSSASPITMSGLRTRTQFRDQSEFYVSNNGSDVSGDGSFLNPYATIQKGITEGEAVSGVSGGVAYISVVNIASGHYNEDLTFGKGYIVLNGVLSTQTTSEVVELTGGVTISCVGTNDTFQRIVSFQGLNITCPAGKLITDNSTVSHTVSFQDCKIASNGQLFLGASTAPDQRTYLTNVDINQTNSATTADIMFFNLGQVEIERVDMSISGNASAIEIGGTAILSRMSLTTLESGTASTTAAPILLISSSTTTSHNIGNSTFFYSNAASKNASASSNAIRIATGVSTVMNLLNCYFTMTGCSGSVNNVIGYNGVGTPTLLMNECRSLSIPVVAAYTTTIQSGITKVNYTNMNGPATGSYSSSADQPAAAAAAATTLTFNTTEKEFNTSLQLTNRIYALATGTYRFDYSIQFDNTDASAQTVNIWISKNGTNVPRSASTVRLGASGAAAHQQFPFCSYTLDLNSGDYVSVLFNATSTNVIANATAAVAPVPAIPSIIVNLQQVGS